ncbi:MAG: AbrB/MazE/SpoVT family DNA-binding domain-containing protein [Nitrococcus sp.]|nr:AbrB/MazE/SpoVT family DNA-binding domain-containing protein [Nitrococcus sp.]
MAHVAGAKGQVVVSKGIRDRLGVQPGWMTVQRLVDGHVEIYFVPPDHRRSLKGALAAHIGSAVGRGKAWDEARNRAWQAVAEEKGGRDQDGDR